MRAPAAALTLLLLSSAFGAVDPRLAAMPDPEPGSLPAATLSLGDGRPVCARVTFDRRKAQAGGRIDVVDDGRAGDEDAIRLSAAVIARRGGFSSRAAISARRHGVSAVALAEAVWESSGPALLLSEPVFGAASREGGLAIRSAEGERKRVVREDDVACVDAASGRVVLPPAGEGEERAAADEAVRAYDGLRDASALERWLEEAPSASRASALMRELAPRALDGGISPDDLARLGRGARAAAGAAGQDALARAERRAWSRALASARLELDECVASASDAPSTDVLDRLSRRARELSSRASAAAKIFGGNGLDAPARACESAASRRRASVPASAPSLEDVAAAAGAARVPSTEISGEAWRLFVSENGLSEFIARTVDDASLGVRRKSERVRARILSARLTPTTEAGRLVAAALVSCPCLIAGDDATAKAADARETLDAVRETWAASWDPGPLGARLRAGQGAAFDGRLRVSAAPKADVSGLLLSRDPGSGRRRVLVEAAPGSIDRFLDGRKDADRYQLEPISGRALDVLVSSPNGRRLLAAGRLERLARLARALDARQGGGIEAAFSFDGERLIVHHAKPLETPRAIRPLVDSLSSRPAPETLNVKPVR